MDELNIQSVPEAVATPGVIKDPVLALAFMFSERTFTLVSEKSGDRFTYKLDEAPKRPTDKPDAPPVYFVKLLTGQNNETDFSYLGFIKGTTFVHGKAKACAGETASSVQGFKFAFSAFQQKRMPTTLRFWHEGKCGRCGRKLSVPESIEAGFGPECVTKANTFQLHDFGARKADSTFVFGSNQVGRAAFVGGMAHKIDGYKVSHPATDGLVTVFENGKLVPDALTKFTVVQGKVEIEMNVSAMVEWKRVNDQEGFTMDGELSTEEAQAFWTKRFTNRPLTPSEMGLQ